MPSPVLLSMDANQNRIGQKTLKLTDDTSSGGSFLWVLSLSVQRKYLVPSGNEKTPYRVSEIKKARLWAGFDLFCEAGLSSRFLQHRL